MNANPQSAARVLVTGAAGFIGSHLARRLRDLGHAVTGLDDLSGGYRRNLPPDVPLVEASIEDAANIDRIFAERKFTHVCHLAAYAAEGLSHFIRGFNYRNNLLGSVALINAAVRHGVRRFLFTSSIAVYGTRPPPVSEETPPAPVDPYGIAKLAVELDLRAAHAHFGLPFTILRPHNVYGEGQNLADPFRNVVGIFLSRLIRGQPLPIFGDGMQSRAFTHIDDLTPLLVDALFHHAAENELFDVGSDQPRTVLELARIAGAALGVEPKFEFLPARPEARHLLSRHDKARERLGFTARIALEEGVPRMAAWARGVAIAPPRPLSMLEIEQGLPPAWKPWVNLRGPG